MKICPVCKREFPDSDKFCCYDGNKLSENKKINFLTCGNCGGINHSSAVSCESCGADLSVNPPRQISDNLDRVNDVDITDVSNKDINDEKKQPIDNPLSLFMPIEGVRLGQTTFQEAHVLPRFAENIIAHDKYRAKHQPNTGCVEIERRGNGDDTVNLIRLYGLSNFKDSWAKECLDLPFDNIGLHKHLSYVEMYAFFTDLGFYVSGLYHEIKKGFLGNTFNAAFIAKSPDESFMIECEFKTYLDITTVEEALQRRCLLNRLTIYNDRSSQWNVRGQQSKSLTSSTDNTKEGNDQLQDNIVDYSTGSWISRIFPIDGVYLGRTTISEAQQLPVFSTSADNNLDTLIKTKTKGVKPYNYECELKSFDYKKYISSELLLRRISNLPDTISALGLKANMSVDTFNNILTAHKFTTNVEYNIETKLFKNNEFSATIIAVSPDSTVGMVFKFFDNRLHHSQPQTSCHLPGTLNSIYIYSRNYNGNKKIFK